VQLSCDTDDVEGPAVSDPGDFDAFYRGSRQRLLGVVFMLTGDVAEAQDAVQEAFIRAWQRWPAIREYENPEAWVRMVACRVATSRWRSMRSRLVAHRRYGTAPPAAAPGPETVDVVAALRRLPDEQRVAIALYYLLGLPVAEVARETSAPVGTVKARLARGRRALAELLALDPLDPVDPLETLGGGRA
jgi:RNA polymerase sigma-70 factor (sigma-E family)